MVKPMCIVDLLMATGNRSVLLPVAVQPIGSLLSPVSGFPKMPVIPLPVPVPNKTKMKALQEIALKAVPNPGEQARKLLPSSHAVRIALENRKYDEMREKYKEEYKLRFRYVCDQLLVLEELNWTLTLFPSHVLWLQR